MTPWRIWLQAAVAACFLLVSARARASLDIEDHGPQLTAGAFAMRITNAGIVGNAFFDIGRSYDPSFEFPPGSGREALRHAELWVGGVAPTGRQRVSGGPLLEWRPTPDPDDVVRIADRTRLGTAWRVDDDADGVFDEEILNGLDDDRDGEVDEDLGLFSAQLASADYVDDRPEAVFSPTSAIEPHEPLGLSVHQEAYAWSAPGFDHMVGLSFRITNHGDRDVRDLYVGLFADLDSRSRSDRTGHIDDEIVTRDFGRTFFDGATAINDGFGDIAYSCASRIDRRLPVLIDGEVGSGLPAVAVVPLDHTIDPLASIGPVKHLARAPAAVSFNTAVFGRGRVPGQGGPPNLDLERYQALAGTFPSALTEGFEDDYAVLVSCGPFPILRPHQSIEFSVALVAADDPDSLAEAVENALLVHRGRTLNLQRDSTGTRPRAWFEGRSGINGHEVCLEPAPGTTFVWDPHCPDKLVSDAVGIPVATPMPTIYRPGECIWTDADCNPCTGSGGRETVVRWLDPGVLPAAPRMRVTALDRAIRIEWDNLPEVLLLGEAETSLGTSFGGYRLYKLSNWTGRTSPVAPRANWQLEAAFGDDASNGEIPLAAIADSTIDYERLLYRERLYPPGRYAYVDSLVFNGFNYLYFVTAVHFTPVQFPGVTRIDRFESAFTPSFSNVVRPRVAARSAPASVWVVPNPFRGRADWDLPPTLDQPLTRHLDFMGLPRARSTIKIWTVAGDFVAQIDHDGSGGSGQASWDLVSRNGQDIMSGVYLFTVDSPLGQSMGRFVVIR